MASWDKDLISDNSTATSNAVSNGAILIRKTDDAICIILSSRSSSSSFVVTAIGREIDRGGVINPCALGLNWTCAAHLQVLDYTITALFSEKRLLQNRSYLTVRFRSITYLSGARSFRARHDFAPSNQSLLYNRELSPI